MVVVGLRIVSSICLTVLDQLVTQCPHRHSCCKVDPQSGLYEINVCTVFIYLHMYVRMYVHVWIYDIHIRG